MNLRKRLYWNTLQDPIPVIISIAVSSSWQGAATLVGVTTAIASLIGASFLPNRHSVYAGCGNFAVYRHLVVVRDVDVNHPLKTS
ncbi:MAG: hypothetical protein IJW37_07255 [Lachnospiraceae bacterium]|nr:hypothetical protein [Lachnospiraceae bacterium]